MKIAKLVTVSFTTRIIVDTEHFNADDISAQYEQMIEENILNKINNGELIENIEFIEDDTVLPYDKDFDED